MEHYHGHCGHGRCLDERCACPCDACIAADESAGNLEEYAQEQWEATIQSAGNAEEE